MDLRARSSDVTRSAGSSTSRAAGRASTSGPARCRYRSAISRRGTFEDNASGPLIADTLSASGAFSYAEREGFTVNDVTGNDLDSRGAFSGKGQLLWKPAPQWEARLIVSGERARDGDYALNDLAALRANPFHSSRDYEGYTNRDIFGTTIQAEHTGDVDATLVDHGVSEVEDRGLDRSRLLAAAAHHA